jgi:hypothetical protein
MSQNFSITGGVANNLAIVCGPSERTSDLLCIISVSGVAVVSKKSAASGGSADEIGVSLGANPTTDNNTYTVKLTEVDVSQLPSSGASYKLYDISEAPETEIETGTIAVSSAESAPVGDAFQVTPICLHKVFTEPGSFGKMVPAGSILSRMLLRSNNANDTGSDITIGIEGGVNNILDESQVLGNVASWVYPVDIATAEWTMQSAGSVPTEAASDVDVDGTFGGAELEIWLFFEKIQ